MTFAPCLSCASSSANTPYQGHCINRQFESAPFSGVLTPQCPNGGHTAIVITGKLSYGLAFSVPLLFPWVERDGERAKASK